MGTVGTDWQPANDAERRLADALAHGDTTAYFRTLAMSLLYLPACRADLAAGRAQRLFTWSFDGETYLLVFTSPDAAQAVRPADTFVTISYRELVEKWPDPSWHLAVNLGLPIDAMVPVQAVAMAALGEVEVPMASRLLDRAKSTDARAAFQPANEVERGLQLALSDDDPDLLMDVLVTATVFVPTREPSAVPIRSSDFPWRRIEETVAVFTSADRMADALPDSVPATEVSFLDMVAAWPAGCQLAINPGSPVEVQVAASRVAGFSEWAAAMSTRYRESRDPREPSARGAIRDALEPPPE